MKFSHNIPTMIHTERGVMPLCEFTDAEIKEYIEEFKKLLIEKRNELRRQRNE